MHDVLAAGSWADTAQIDSIALDYDQRHRRRLLLTTASGVPLLLDLARTRRLREGDGLRVQHGVVRIIAAPEPVMDIHADPASLIRIAWHLGNRHLAVQVHDGCLRIRADHVIANMAAGLGGHVHTHAAPFEPEGGAYASAPAHTHRHDGDDDHHHHE